MAPPMLDNPLIFAEAYDKSDSNNNSLRSEITRNDMKTIKVNVSIKLTYQH